MGTETSKLRLFGFLPKDGSAGSCPGLLQTDVPEVPDPSGAVLGDLAAQLTRPKVATSLTNSLQSGMSEAFFPSRDLILAPVDETLGEGCVLLLQRGMRES